MTASVQNRGWYTRFLPHRDISGLTQFITYRLGDSLSEEELTRIVEELAIVPPERMETERRRRMEEWLDAGHGSCMLRDAAAAQCVMENWRRFDGERYDLIAWVVMPNHVHVLIQMYPGVPLAKVVQSWKSFTGKRLGALMEERLRNSDRTGARCTQGEGVWMREYWDRVIRDEKHFWASIEYIENNPVKAGMVRVAKEWPWSSAAVKWCDEGMEDNRYA